jgi:uncharacterized protein (UPF0335 family)
MTIVIQEDGHCGGGAAAPELSTESKQKLVSYIERVERLEEEKAALSEDVSSIFKTAKSEGYDVKAMRHVIRLRRKDAEERNDELNALDVYLRALDMVQ